MIKYPSSQEREYQRFIKSILNEFALIVKTSVNNKLSSFILLNKDEDEEESDFSEEIGYLISALLFLGYINQRQKANLGLIALSISSFTSKEIQDFFKSKYKITLPYEINKKSIANWVSLQEASINAKIKAFVDSIDLTVRSQIAQKKTISEIKKSIDGIYKKFINQAGFISGNGTGNLSSETQRDMLTKSNVYKYAWVTQHDHRVRPAHVARDGVIFDWRVQPNDGHPGMPYLCRCVAAPVFEDGDKVRFELSMRNTFDLTVYRKGVMPEQRPERDIKYAAVLKSGVMTKEEIKLLSEKPESAIKIYQTIEMSGRYRFKN